MRKRRDIVAEAEATGVEMDKPLVVKYDDGTEVTLPTWREICEEQQKLEDEADEILRVMFPEEPK